MMSVKALHLLGNTMQYRTTNQHTNKTMQYIIMQCSTMQYNNKQYCTILHTTATIQTYTKQNTTATTATTVSLALGLTTHLPGPLCSPVRAVQPPQCKHLPQFWFGFD